jgi:hypothetical protein
MGEKLARGGFILAVAVAFYRGGGYVEQCGGGGDSEVVPRGEEVGEGPSRRSATARSRH